MPFQHPLLPRVAAFAAPAALLILLSCESPSGPDSPPPDITTTDLPAATVGEPYEEAVVATGGDGEYFWEIVSGSLPTGLELTVDDLTLTEALITGIPTSIQTRAFWVRVEDGHDRADSVRLTIEVDPPPTPVTITTVRLPPPLAGFEYDVRLSAIGGDSRSYSWSLVEGSLPDGLTLSSDGFIRGVAVDPGTYTFTVQAASGEQSTRNTFTLQVVPNDTDRFNITAVPIVDIPDNLVDNVQAAVDRWEAAIIGDLSVVAAPEEACFGYRAGAGTVIDDIIILINIDEIDGPLGTIAQAGFCFFRESNTLPVMGILTFDEVDLEGYTNEERITDVLQHEMGHVLGFSHGLWNYLGLAENVEEGSTTPRFIGENAVAVYQAAGGDTEFVPLESGGGEGTQFSHWNETLFGNELMTGFANPNESIDSYLSALTIASFADVGYTVNMDAADRTLFALRHDGSAGISGRPWGEMEEILTGPLISVSADGVITNIHDH